MLLCVIFYIVVSHLQVVMQVLCQASAALRLGYFGIVAHFKYSKKMKFHRL